MTVAAQGLLFNHLDMEFFFFFFVYNFCREKVLLSCKTELSKGGDFAKTGIR